MKEATFETVGGLKAPIQVYTLEDFVPQDVLTQLPEPNKKKLGDLCTEANNNMVYRGVLPVVREEVCKLVEDTLAVPRESKVVGKTKGGKDITQWEADGKYVNRVMGLKGLNDLSQFQTQLDAICREYKAEGETEAKPLAVDIEGRVRAPSTTRLATIFKLAAAKAITLGSDINSKLASIKKTFTAKNDTSKMFAGTFPADDPQVGGKPYNVSDADAEELGRLIKEYQEWRLAQEGF